MRMTNENRAEIDHQIRERTAPRKPRIKVQYRGRNNRRNRQYRINKKHVNPKATLFRMELRARVWKTLGLPENMKSSGRMCPHGCGHVVIRYKWNDQPLKGTVPWEEYNGWDSRYTCPKCMNGIINYER